MASCAGCVGRRRRRQGGLRRVFRNCVANVGRQPAAEDEQHRTDEEEGQLGQARQETEAEDDRCDGPHDTAVAGQLQEHVDAEVVLRGGAGDDDAGRQRHQKSGYLADETVADRQQAVGVAGDAERVVVLEDADGEAAEQVHRGDDDGGDGVAADELRGTVHRPVEVGLVGDLAPAGPGLVGGDELAGELAVDGHLLSGQRVEGEAGRDLGDPPGAVGDHDELDHDQDQEHDEADEDRSADHEVAEALDDHAGVGVEQHEPAWRSTFNARRNTVMTRSRVGKTENSSGRLTCIAVNSTSIDAEMLSVIRMSSTKLGNGITSITTTAVTARGRASIPKVVDRGKARIGVVVSQRIASHRRCHRLSGSILDRAVAILASRS